MIMESEKFYDLPSVIWRTSKAGNVIQSKSEDLRTRSSDV